MRLITSPQLSKEDIQAIKNAETTDKENDILTKRLEESLFEGDYLELVKTDRFQCLAWMIEQGHLEIRIAYMEDDGESDPFRIYHEKLGILGDDHGHRVAFSGSINETAAAWTQNSVDHIGLE